MGLWKKYFSLGYLYFPTIIYHYNPWTCIVNPYKGHHNPYNYIYNPSKPIAYAIYLASTAMRSKRCGQRRAPMPTSFCGRLLGLMVRGRVWWVRVWPEHSAVRAWWGVTAGLEIWIGSDAEIGLASSHNVLTAAFYRWWRYCSPESAPPRNHALSRAPTSSLIAFRSRAACGSVSRFSSPRARTAAALATSHGMGGSIGSFYRS